MTTIERRRAIGTIGTGVRAVLGCVLVGAVAWGEMRGRPPVGLAVGLVGFPAVVLGWQWLRSRWWPGRLEATGAVATAVNCAVGVAAYLIGWFVPPLWFTSDAVLVFYGASMLLAAARGYAGCEVLAISNWLLRRDDQLGCVVLSNVDRLDAGRRVTAA